MNYRIIKHCLLTGVLLSCLLVQNGYAQCFDLSLIGNRDYIRCFDYHVVKTTSKTTKKEVFSWDENDGAVAFSPEDHPRQTLITEQGTDDLCPELSTLPQGATQSIRIATTDYQKEDIALGAACANYYDVTEDNCLVKVRYAAVMHNPMHEIASRESFEDFAQPNITIKLTNWKPDGKSFDVECPKITLYSNIESQKEQWHKTKGTDGKDIIWLDWTTILFDLSDYIGERMIIQITALDCAESDYDIKNERITLCTERHRARVYYTLDCESKDITVEQDCSVADSVFLSAPAYYNSYRWYNKANPEETLCTNQVYRTLRLKEDATYCCELTDMCQTTTIEQLVYATRYYVDKPDTLHFGETYTWDKNGKTYSHSIKDTVRIPHLNSGCDSIVYCLDLPVKDDPCEFIKLEQKWDNIDLENVSEYTWDKNGKTYYQSAKDTVLIKSEYDCDSIIYYLNLNMTGEGSFKMREQELCADADSLHVLINYTGGELTAWDIRFDNNAIRAGFRDTTNDKHNGINDIALPIPMNDDDDWTTYPRPGTYTLTLTEQNSFGETHEHVLSFTLLYPSQVIGQRWDDILFIQNETYNGGYTISHVSWYKNDVEVEGKGEHGAYYFEQDNFSDDDIYYAALTRADDGQTVCTCKYTPEESYDDDKPELQLSIQPVEETSLSNRRAIRVVGTTVGYYRLYDISGRMLQQGSFTSPQGNIITLPSLNAGTYILTLLPETGKTLSKKIIVK